MSVKNSEPRDVTLYDRQSGAICYEMDLLGPAGVTPAVFVAGLLGSKLRWLWESEVRPRVPSAPRTEQDRRHLTHLTRVTNSSLVEDLSERDVDGYGRFVAIFGTCGSPPESVSPSDWLATELPKFASDQGGDIELVIIQMGAANDYVYLRRHPVTATRELFHDWGVEVGQAPKVKDYRRLRAGALESLFHLVRLPGA